MEPEGALPLAFSVPVCAPVYVQEPNAGYFLIIHCLLLSVLLSLPHPFLPSVFLHPLPLQWLEINCTLNTRLLSERLVTNSMLNGQHLLKMSELVMGRGKDGDGEQSRGLKSQAARWIPWEPSIN